MTESATVATPESTDPFRWRLAHRPDIRFGHAAGGVAGVLAAAAVIGFVVKVTGDDPTLPGVGFNLLLIAVALFAGFRMRGPVRSAAVSAIVVAVPLLWAFAVFGDNDSPGRGDFRLVLLLTVASYVVFYLLTWTRGRAILLGLALLFAAGWLVFEVASQDTPFLGGLESTGPFDDTPFPSSSFGSSDNQTETGIVELIIAAVALGASVLLDRRGRAGVATPCIFVGSIYAVSAAFLLGGDIDDVYITALFVVIAGLAIGLVGSLGRRRLTSYVGAIVLLGGVATVVGKLTDDTASGDDDAALLFGIFGLLGAVVLVVAGILIAKHFEEPVDGGEPAPPPPAPVPATPAMPTQTSDPPVAESDGGPPPS